MFYSYYLYQFGDLQPFTRASLQTVNTGNVKTVLDDSLFSDGTARVNFLNRDRKNDYIIKTAIQIDKFNDDIQKIKKLVYNKPQKIFFVGFDTRPDAAVPVKFFWNYATGFNFPDKLSAEEELGRDTKIINIEFRLLNPFFYECDTNDLSYVDLSSLARVKYDDTADYDTGVTYDQLEISTTKYLTDLNAAQIDTLFGLSVFKPTNKVKYVDRFFARESHPKSFNYLSTTEDFSSSAWTKTDGTVALNSGMSWTLNTDATQFTVTAAPVDASITQSGITTPRGDLVFQVALKQGSAGNASHFRLIQSNTPDGTSTGPLTAITSGVPLGQGFFLHTFIRTTSVQTNTNSVKVSFRTSGNAQPAAGSTILAKRPSLHHSLIAGSNPQYQARLASAQSNFSNFQNAFTYVLTSNNVYTTVYTNPLNLETDFENKVMVIGTTSLSLNNYFEIVNDSNNTGVRITWLENSTSPAIMLFYPHKNELYNGLTGALINVYSGQFKIETLGLGMLKFNNRKVIDPVFDNQTFDILRIRKSSSGNFPIFIKNLPTYN